MPDNESTERLALSADKALVDELATRLSRAIGSQPVDAEVTADTASRPALNSEVDDFVTSLQLRNVNLRRHLFERGFERDDADLFSSEALTALRQRLAAHEALRGCDEASLTVAVCLVAVHVARSQTRPTGIEGALGWAERQPHNTSPRDWLTLSVAEAHRKLAEARSGAVSLPSAKELEDLCDRIEECGEPDDDHEENRDRLRLWLAGAISEVPPSILRKDEHEEIRDIAKELSAERKSRREQMQARFAYVRSALEYCGKDEHSLSNAREECHRALTLTSGTDPQFIERCQRRLDYLELEEASRDANREDISKRVTKDVGDITEKQVQDSKQELTRDLGETRDRILEKTQTEIKDALLRVVEVLGVFMAIAGVAATTISGALATDTAGQALLVYGLGGATVLGLFAMLRLIAGLGTIRRGGRERNDSDRSGDTPMDGTSTQERAQA